MSEQATIEIKDTDGTLATIAVNRILFFWQKIIGAERRLVTQIVYGTDLRDPPIMPERGSVDLARECPPPDICLEGDSNLNTIRYRRWWDVESRNVIDTPISLDAVRDLILSVAASIKFVTLHRAYTREDSRVLFPYPLPPKMLLDMIQTHKRCRLMDIEELRVSRMKEESLRERAAGGGSVVDDFPHWILGTHGTDAILITESTDQITRAIAAVPLE